MALLGCFLLFLLADVGLGKVLMEISFDLALQQESEKGYTAAHTVGEHLNDPNVIYLRYFHTLASGKHGYAHMRHCHLEFEDRESWLNFESTNLDRTHILYDLFWINWRRLLWVEEPETGDIPKMLVREADKTGGYIHSFRFAIIRGKEAEFERWYKQSMPKGNSITEANSGYITRQVYTSGMYQSEYHYLINTEYIDLPSLSKTHFENEEYVQLMNQAKPLMSRYATGILVPSSDNTGGLIFRGAGAPL
eukprot:TRINITY_DN7005_c0_g1_i1.p1 TRINITY_DN7005_c0_g1~~TRINITY_DN7005_c0_g1_i1.p1  ORF type:complete len:267 (-),score=53.02 TRINITY_DN7005_c0_g1_i1:69-818(-)